MRMKQVHRSLCYEKYKTEYYTVGRLQKQTILEIVKTDKVHWFSRAMRKTSRYLNRTVFLKLSTCIKDA